MLSGGSTTSGGSAGTAAIPSPVPSALHPQPSHTPSPPGKPSCVEHGYIDSTLMSKSNIRRPELNAINELYREKASTDTTHKLAEWNTGTFMSLPKTQDEIDGTFSGAPPKLIVDVYEEFGPEKVLDEHIPAGLTAPDGQFVWKVANVSLARGGELYTPETLAGFTLSFSMLRENKEADDLLVWWQNAADEWVSMPCPPNDTNTIDFEILESLGTFVLTRNE